MARSVLIGSSAAGQLCGISPQLLVCRAKSGKLPIARRHPLGFRPSDVLEARDRMAQKDPRGRHRKTNLELLAKEVLA